MAHRQGILWKKHALQARFFVKECAAGKLMQGGRIFLNES
jgi:hypothetical protein